MKEKAFASFPQQASEVRPVQWSRKWPQKGQYFKVLKLRKKWTHIMSNCSGECEIGKM